MEFGADHMTDGPYLNGENKAVLMHMCPRLQWQKKTAG